jgi:autotransporter translocation and assembly factor TamB
VPPLRKRLGWIVALGIGALLAVLVAAVWLFREPIVRVVGAQAFRAAGFEAQVATLDVRLRSLAATGIDIRSASGEPVATIARIDVRYNLRDLLPGSSRLFGLESIDVERPAITIVRHRDGSLNVAIPAQTGAGALPNAPLIFDGHVRDGSVDVRDYTQDRPAGLHLAVRSIDAQMHVATNARTRYDARLSYVEDARTYPIYGRGDIDVVRGIADQRWTAVRLPIANLANFADGVGPVHVAAGEIDAIDARMVGLRARDGPFSMYPSLTARLAGARVAIAGLAKPLRDAHGLVAAYTDGLVLRDGAGTMAGVPLAIDGAVFGLTAPSIRLGISGTGDLSAFRQVLAQSAAIPIRGRLRLDINIVGRVTRPLVFIALHAPRAVFKEIPFDGVDGLVAFDEREADLISLNAEYAGIGVRVNGRVALPHAKRDARHRPGDALAAIAALDAPPGTIPYASDILPGMPLHASVVATGKSIDAVDTRGLLTGTSGARTLAATFDVHGNGIGTLGPMSVRGPGESLFAIAEIDRRHDSANAFVDARGLHVDTRGRPTSSPGLSLPAVPALAVTLDARVFASANHARLSASGVADARNLSTSFGRVAHARVQFSTTPESAIGVALEAQGIDPLGERATAMLTYRNGTVNIEDAAASAGATFANARGSLEDRGGVLAYDVRARVQSADLSPLAAMARPELQQLVEGSAQADVAIAGRGNHPSLSGDLSVPEGAVNGLSFHALHTTFSGTLSRLSAADGSVTLASSVLHFFGEASASGGKVSVNAPQANLSDFNDFFDPGSLFGGFGSVDASASFTPKHLEATSGTAAFQNASWRDFPLGIARANWRSRAGSNVALDAALDGPNGRLSATGTVALNGAVDLNARAGSFDLAAWLPMAGLTAPVAGLADADVRAAGRFPDLNANVHAQVRDASFSHIPISEVTADASTSNGRGRLSSFTLAISGAQVRGSGSFGLHPRDPLDLTFLGDSPSVATLAHTVTGRHSDADGALTTQLHVMGTRNAPRVSGQFVLSKAHFGHVSVPRVAGALEADTHTVALRSVEVDLERGRVLAHATVPIRVAPFALDGFRPLQATLVADGVEASSVASLFPQDTKLEGRVDGQIDLSGTADKPSFDGSLALTNAAFSGSAAFVPIAKGTATLAFSGTTMTLQQAHATSGNGSIEATGNASVPSVRNFSDLVFDLRARAQNADVNHPDYFRGRFDADLRFARTPESRPILSGTIDVPYGRIPATALLNLTSAEASTTAPPNIGFDLHATVGRDMRLQSRNVDVGATGAVNLAGTLASPSLDGIITSTGGTISFYRTLRIERATVQFHPTGGIIPTVDAAASTYIADPPTDILLTVTGPATAMNLVFTSSPPYETDRILAILAGAAPGAGGFDLPATVSQLAVNQVNDLFTRNLLEPLSAQLGASLGLENFQITSDLQRGLGLSASRAIGRNLNFTYSDTFGQPRRQAITIQTRGEATYQFALTLYTTTGQLASAVTQPIVITPLSIGDFALIPIGSGENGFDFRVKRTFP